MFRTSLRHIARRSVALRAGRIFSTSMVQCRADVVTLRSCYSTKPSYNTQIISETPVTYASELSSSDVGKTVHIRGWLQASRVLHPNWFGVIRDHSGTIQFIYPQNNSDTGLSLVETPIESVVRITGKLAHRPEQDRRSIDELEIQVESFEVINSTPTDRQLPFSLFTNKKKKTNSLNEEERRMKYRYLELRTAKMQRLLQMRSSLSTAARIFLTKQENGFMEIETPILFKSTPEGANEFVVPTRNHHFYALPQSPQQYKQLLMVSGVHRYFQFARCFRDENSRADRQPEFTQIDIEMAFPTRQTVLRTTEKLIQTMSLISNPDFTFIPGHLAQKPFFSLEGCEYPAITFRDALDTYGIDKPDTRFGLELIDLTKILKVPDITVKSIISRGLGMLPPSKILKMVEKARGTTPVLMIKITSDDGKKWKLLNKDQESNDILKTLIFQNENQNDAHSLLTHQFDLKKNDVLFITKGTIENWQKVCETMGRTRVMLATLMQENNLLPQFDPLARNFLWVVDFPMFELVQKQNKVTGEIYTKIKAVHHPFTTVHPEDKNKLMWILTFTPQEIMNDVGLQQKLVSIRSQSYDIVLNGTEIGGGSIRIHDSTIQTKIFNLIEAETHTFRHLLEALEWGCPPHGGIALGFDRFVAMMLSETADSLRLRDVIAFPKSNQGKDLMVGSPSVHVVEEEEI